MRGSYFKLSFQVSLISGEWLPTEADAAYVATLMKPAVEPGSFANWIAAPARGINSQPVDFRYVRLD